MKTQMEEKFNLDFLDSIEKIFQGQSQCNPPTAASTKKKKEEAWIRKAKFPFIVCHLTKEWTPWGLRFHLPQLPPDS